MSTRSWSTSFFLSSSSDHWSSNDGRLNSSAFTSRTIRSGPLKTRTCTRGMPQVVWCSGRPCTSTPWLSAGTLQFGLTVVTFYSRVGTGLSITSSSAALRTIEVVPPSAGMGGGERLMGYNVPPKFRALHFGALPSGIHSSIVRRG